MSALIPATGGMFTNPSGETRRPSSALSRANKREIDQIVQRVEVEAAAEQGRAFLAAHALTNVATLVHQAEAHMKVAPAGAAYYEALIASYAISAGRRIGQM